MLERVPPGEVHDRLEATGTRLAALLDQVHQVCLTAQRIAPSEGEDLPGGRGGLLLDAHRELARSATLAAQSGETVMLAIATLRSEHPDEAARLAAAADRTVDQVADRVTSAGDLVRSAEAL
jgi:hypothetical protein